MQMLNPHLDGAVSQGIDKCISRHAPSHLEVYDCKGSHYTSYIMMIFLKVE